MITMPRLPKTAEPFQRVAFFGPMASGKTFLANHLVAHHGYQKVAFADKLKAIAYELFGTQSKDGEGRIILQQIGDAMRAIDKDVWVKYTLATIKYKSSFGKDHKNSWSLGKEYSKWVIDDLRLANEAVWLKKNGFTLIYVDAQENIRADRIATLYPNSPPEAVLHASEQEYKGIVADYTLLNNSFMSLFHLDALVGEVGLENEDSINR